MLILFSSINIMRLKLQLAVSRLSVLIVSDMILLLQILCIYTIRQTQQRLSCQKVFLICFILYIVMIAQLMYPISASRCWHLIYRKVKF